MDPRGHRESPKSSPAMLPAEWGGFRLSQTDLGAETRPIQLGFSLAQRFFRAHGFVAGELPWLYQDLCVTEGFAPTPSRAIRSISL